MDDFGKIVYLDVQKTGSTFVSKFLDECFLGDRVLFKKHGRVRGEYRKDAFYFITSRNPYSLYRSLYRYGLDGRGGIYNSLSRKGFSYLYDAEKGSYNEWLSFMLDGENADILGEGYSALSHLGIGFMTYRFLVLCFSYPIRTMQRANDFLDIVDIYHRETIVDKIVKNEEMNSQLLDIATIDMPELFDRGKVEKFLSGSWRANRSRAQSEESVNAINVRMIENKEFFIFSEIYK